MCTHFHAAFAVSHIQISARKAGNFTAVVIRSPVNPAGHAALCLLHTSFNISILVLVLPAVPAVNCSHLLVDCKENEFLVQFME